MNYSEFFDQLNNLTRWDVGVSIDRSNAIPWDASSIFSKYEDLTSYVEGNPPEGYIKNAYPGQLCAVVTEEKTDLYLIVYDESVTNNLRPIRLQVELNGDNKSVTLLSNTIQLSGFLDALDNCVPIKRDEQLYWASVSELIDAPLEELAYAIDDTVANLRSFLLGEGYAEGEDIGGLIGEALAKIRGEQEASHAEMMSSTEASMSELSEKIDKIKSEILGDESSTGNTLHSLSEELEAIDKELSDHQELSNHLSMDDIKRFLEKNYTLSIDGNNN